MYLYFDDSFRGPAVEEAFDNMPTQMTAFAVRIATRPLDVLLSF